MKKKIVLSLLLISLFLLVGCGKKENQPKEDTLADDEVILENIKYKFDQDSEEYGLKIKIANNLRRVDTGNTISFYSEKIEDSSYFVFRIFKYKNKSLDFAIKDTTNNDYLSKTTTTIDDKEYTVVRFKNPIGDNTYTNLYYYKHNKDTDAFGFTSYLDLSRLEEIFLKSIVYE